MTDPIELIYDLHLLAPGRLPFRRWRWELWHGPQLLAARYAHRLHGLHPLRPDAAHGPESAWAGRTVAVDWGDLRVVLTPRAVLESPGRWLSPTGRRRSTRPAH